MWALKLGLVFVLAATLSVLAARPFVSWPLSLAVAAAVTAASAGYMALARKVGPLTAVPALALAVGVLVAAAVLMPPDCPVAPSPAGLPVGRCGVADTATTVTTAMLTVVMVAAFTRVPYRAARWLLLVARRAGSALWHGRG